MNFCIFTFRNFDSLLFLFYLVNLEEIKDLILDICLVEYCLSTIHGTRLCTIL